MELMLAGGAFVELLLVAILGTNVLPPHSTGIVEMVCIELCCCCCCCCTSVFPQLPITLIAETCDSVAVTAAACVADVVVVVVVEALL